MIRWLDGRLEEWNIGRMRTPPFHLSIIPIPQYFNNIAI